MFTTIICTDTGEIVYTYEEYLSTVHWSSLRERYIIIFGKYCEYCGDTGTQVHHLYYDTLGNESFEDVVLLCESCHKKEHNL